MLNKCYEDYYLDFLVYLAGLEFSNLKIYNLFESISKGEVEVGDCYRQLANSYILVEKAVGDPPQALRYVSEIPPYGDLSKFLRDYSSVMITSGDTKSFVEHSIKQEFAKYRARVNELLKALDVLYESYLVVVLVALFFIVLPIASPVPVLSLLAIYASSLTGYLLAFRICRKIYYTVPSYLVVFDVAASTAVFALALTSHGVAYAFIPLVLLHLFAKKLNRGLLDLENESIRLVYDVYSQVLMGKSTSNALVTSLRGSSTQAYRLLWLGLILGYNPSEILKKVKLPKFAEKVLSMMLSSLPYSSLGEAHIAHVVMFVDEVEFVRRSVREKARFYMFYSLLVVALILATYFMLTRTPALFRIDKHALATYSFVSPLLISKPAVLIRDRGFTSSNVLIPLLACSLLVYIGILLLA